MYYSGGYSKTGRSVYYYDGSVRPAFNLNLSSVLFTSASSADKSSFASVGTDHVNTNTWKLTLKDDWLTVEDIAITSKMVSGYDKTKLGEQTITVTYDTNKTTTFKVTVKLPEYKFTEGTDQTITADDNKDLTFRIDAPLEYLEKVYLNDKELDTANYTTASGSTIITLKKEYVSTLSAGTYTLKATYTNGASASTDFVIKAKETTPTTPTDPTNPNVNTGDNSNMTLWTSILCLSALISLGYVVLNKKRKMNEYYSYRVR